MKVRCIKNEGDYERPVVPIVLGECNEPDDNFMSLSHGGLDTYGGDFPQHFDFTIGMEYDVYGILQYDNLIRYLVQNNFGIWAFAPKELFELTDRSLPYDWSMNIYELEYGTMKYGTMLIIGYDALTDGYENFIGIANWEEWALRKLQDYKDWLSKWT